MTSAFLWKSKTTRSHKSRIDRTICLIFLNYLHIEIYDRAVAEQLRYRSREENVPSSIPRLGISVEVTSQY